MGEMRPERAEYLRQFREVGIVCDTLTLREFLGECLDAIADLQRENERLTHLYERTLRSLESDNAALRARLAELERPVVVDTTNQGE